MKTHIWLTTVALALAGMTGLAGVASAEHPTFCKQEFEYPPVCCAYISLIHPGVNSIRGLAACDWAP